MTEEPNLIALLDQVDWRTVLASAQERDVFLYGSAFCSAAAIAQVAPDSHAAHVFRFFALLCSSSLFIIDPSPKKRPKGAESSLSPPWCLTDFHLDAASALLGTTGDAELEARLGDVLWLRRKDHRAAKAAIVAYLNSAASIEDPTNWVRSHERYKRALELSAAVDRKGPAFALAVKKIEETLERLGGDDPLYFSLRLTDDLRQHGGGNLQRQAELLEYRGSRSSQVGTRPEVDADYLERSAAIFLKLGDNASAGRCLVGAAESLVIHAQRFMQSRGNRGAGTHWLEKAILLLRRVPATESREEELLRDLAAWQRLVTEDFISHSVEMDIPDAIVKRIKVISALPFEQAVRELACIVQPQAYDKLRESVDIRASSPLFRIMPPSWVRADGKNDARLGNTPHDEELPETDLHKLMHDSARIGWTYLGFIIASAVQEIRNNHSVSDCNLDWLVGASGFVPNDRKGIFKRGLEAGFVFDAEFALHFLVPQIENSLRHLLSSKVVTFSLKSDQIQDERLLTWLLECPEAVEVLGPDTVFDLRGLLNERTGLNLRNELAHGMIPDGRLNQSSDAFYVWWLVLRLCVIQEAV